MAGDRIGGIQCQSLTEFGQGLMDLGLLGEQPGTLLGVGPGPGLIQGCNLRRFRQQGRRSTGRCQDPGQQQECGSDHPGYYFAGFFSGAGAIAGAGAGADTAAGTGAEALLSSLIMVMLMATAFSIKGLRSPW